jgi:putative acetyltransferase
MYKIRRSRPDDGEHVIALWRAAVDATHDFLSREDRLAIEVEVRAFLPEASLWLAVDDNDHPLGFMLLDGGHMDALFVDPVVRGRGVGAELVRHALQLHPKLTTEVNEQNEQAVGFYERMGFGCIGRTAFDNQGRPYPLIRLQR